MRGVIKSVIWFLFFLAIAILEVIIYYRVGGKESYILLFIELLLTMVVLVITIMACYQSYKHRNDEEEW